MSTIKDQCVNKTMIIGSQSYPNDSLGFID